MIDRDPEIDDEYAARLADFAVEHDVSRERAERAFREHCRTFREATTEDTSASTIRRLAFRKLEWHPPGE